VRRTGDGPDSTTGPPGGGPRVALTFDAELPHERHDRDRTRDGGEAILDALARARARATFFLQTAWVVAFPELARRIAHENHLIGSHSTAHVRSTLLSDDELRENVLEAGESIAAVTGVDPAPWFRCPYGDGHDDPRVLGVLAEVGYENVHWDVDPEDWARSRDADAVVRAVVDGATPRARTIILLHSWPRATAVAVPLVLANQTAVGASFVTVDELDPT
jgi:peptidoglycan/xylan/chitin deacetylase (PgdA/CDA1 family)